MCKKGMDAREMLRPLSDYRCPCCQLLNISDELVKLDEDLIGIVGFKPDITRACNCFEYDKKIQEDRKEKGLTVALNSSHKCDDKDEKCEALDYAIRSSWQRAVIIIALVELGIKRIGLGDDFLHWDIDPKKPSPVFWMY